MALGCVAKLGRGNDKSCDMTEEFDNVLGRRENGIAIL